MTELLPPLPVPGNFTILPDGRRLTSRPSCGGMGALEAVILPPAGELGERMELWGEAHIKNGPGRCEVPGCGCDQMHKIARNKIVGQGLSHMMNRLMQIIANGNTGGSPGVLVATFETNQLTRSYIRVGTGTGATSNATTALGTQVATNPDATALTTSNPSTGVYRHSFTATWNAGSITGATVREIGVFGTLALTFGTVISGDFGSTPNPNHTVLSMFARLSTTDSEFSSFVINTANPLVIEYRITLTFT